MVLGLVTIGQAPRDDVTASMFGAVDLAGVCQVGALDGLTASEIVALAPGRDDSVLVSRLADGSEVELGKHRITPLVQRAVHSSIEAGASVVCILCTGKFEGVRAEVPMLFPDQILSGIIDALLPVGTLGVLMPHEEQHDIMSRRWSTSIRSVVTASVSPYSNSKSIDVATASLCDGGAELIVMDCMGFTREMERKVRAASGGTPVILGNGMVGRVITETWDLGGPND